jgi:hypothetical protein
VFRADLLDLLSPYHVDGIRGDCFVGEPDASLPISSHETCYVTRDRELLVSRGKNCRHRQCRYCKRFLNRIGWAKDAVVDRYLDDRLVYQDDTGWMYVEEGLVAKLKLPERFKDLKLKRVRVVPEPLDGDVLPGDPGWTGRFKEQPLPKPR